jgi:hypothetical protein
MPQCIYANAIDFMPDWNSVRVAGFNRGGHVDPIMLKWCKPAPGRVKCNTDAAFSTIKSREWIDICIIDENCIFTFYPCKNLFWFVLWGTY